MKMNETEFFEVWSKAHGDAEIKGVVKAWLKISFRICNFLLRLRLTPNGLTYSALFLALGFIATIESNWAILFLVLSLAADGLDGTLAMISNRVTKWGATLDAVVDRAVEIFWVLGLFVLGGDIKVLLLAGIAAFTQEYLRARAAGLGVNKIGVITPAERPVRASLVFVALIAQSFDYDLIGIICLAWLILQSFSLTRLIIALRPLLQQSQR